MLKKIAHSGSMDSCPSLLEQKHRELARELAAEGIVVLRNDQILPLKVSKPLALLGSGAGKTVKGGIGSGDVNNRQTISIYEGLLDAGAVITSNSWLKQYSNCYQNAREVWKEKILEEAKHVDNPFDAYASNPFALPSGRDIEEQDLEGATAAIYVISRISGEGKDRRLEKGDYYLSDQERKDLLYLDQRNLPIILLINSGGPVELTEILEETTNIRGILNISQTGQEVGGAVADILFGKVVPSGKLTSTWAMSYSDYPCGADYSYLNGDLTKERYKEGIYVGYRYFDSFGIHPLFPFGYGLSYTKFQLGFQEIEVRENKLQIKVNVKNIGNTYAGKEVVQVYLTSPQDEIPREYRRLVGFCKTNKLQPEEEEVVSIEINQKSFAVFSEENQEWFIEAGKYGIWIGNSSDNLQLEAFISISNKVVLEKTHRICSLEEDLEELVLSHERKLELNTWIEEGEKLQIPEYYFTPQQEEKLKVHNVIADQKYSVEELIPLLYGNITEGTSTLGSAGIRVPGSAGETSECLEEKYGIPSLIMADGPAGIRLRQCYQVDKISDIVYGTGVFGSLENGFLEPMKYYDNADTYYQFCTAFPVGTALAQTWNLNLVRKFGIAIAEEMKEYGVNLWLAPGMNIQRNPLCGRNFEYFSEDPILTGYLAAEITKGVQSISGCAVTLKHFACNNQEDNRMSVDSQISEKALREIYLRGFEIAIKESNPDALMTSYNLINGVHTANSYDLCTVVAREEWGFQGVIMSDWNTTVPWDGSIPWKCVEAGNDIIMPGNRDDDKDIRTAYAQGKLSEIQIRECAGRIIKLAQKLSRG
ncbi:MAG: glycoside hydrolase family 3 C-terminal domain-containing protein [Candidatus Ruminococcus intestinipullorum]|nr:glycoside hydrolase family 3 C-terminal domain-containing protein [Candidatus Ruminococcus intestinipullorum]